jgi:hypothetical protein
MASPHTRSIGLKEKKRSTICSVRLILVATVVMLFFPVAAREGHCGDHRTFGLGFVLGEPTGLSSKIFLTPSGALDFDLAFSFLEGSLYFSGDYLHHFANVLPGNSTVIFRPYIGGGGAIAGREEEHLPHDRDRDRDHSFGLAGRFTAGMSFLFVEVPIEIFVDVSPGIWLVPETDLYFAGVLGVRYFF